MAQPPPASLAHIPVDTSKTEPIAAFYKLQFGDELTGFAYYMRTLVVTIGRNVVAHNTPPPVITTPNVPAIPPLDDQLHSGSTPTIRNLSLHNAAFEEAESVDKSLQGSHQGDEEVGPKSETPLVTVHPPPGDDMEAVDGPQGDVYLDSLAVLTGPTELPEVQNGSQAPSQSQSPVVDAGAAADAIPAAQALSPSQSHLPIIRDILDGPPPPPPPKSQPPAEPVDVDLGALKSVSRFHAKIEYCADRAQFCLEIHGRNGAWVDGRFFVKGCKVPLEQGSQIQIATRIFSFVLPPSADGSPGASPVLPQDDYSYPHHLHYHHAGYQDFFGDAGPSTVAARIPPRFNAFANGEFIGLGADGQDGGEYAYGWDSDEEGASRDSLSSDSWDSEADDQPQEKRRLSVKSRNGTSGGHGKGKQKLRQSLFGDDSDLSSLSSEDGGDEMDEDHDEDELRGHSSAESSYSERQPTSHRKRDRKSNGIGLVDDRVRSSDDEDEVSDVPLAVSTKHDKKKGSHKKKTEVPVKVIQKTGAGKGGKGQLAKKNLSPDKHKAKEAAAKAAQAVTKVKSKKGKGAASIARSESAAEAFPPASTTSADRLEVQAQHAGKRPKGGKWAAKSLTPAILSEGEDVSIKKEEAVSGDNVSTPKKDKKKKKDKEKAQKPPEIPGPAQPASSVPIAAAPPARPPAPEDNLPPTLAAAVAAAAPSPAAAEAAKAKKPQPPAMVPRPSITPSADGSFAGSVKTESQATPAVPPPPLTLAAVVASTAAKPGLPGGNAGPTLPHSAPLSHPIPPPPPVEKPKPPPPPPFQHLTELIDTPGRPGHIIVNVPIPPSGAGPRPPPAPIVGLDGKPFIGPDPQKPTLTFATIIHRALLHLPRGRGTLGEVCNWVAGEWEYFRLNPEAGWQNSIRHNLSLNKAFLKVARIPSDDPESKGSVWIIDPEEGPLFEEKQRRDAEKSEGKQKNAEVKAERERQRAELKAKKAKDKDYIGKDGLPLKPGDPKLRMMTPAGSLPRPNLVRPAGTGPGVGPVLAKGKITVVVQPVTSALRARSSLLSKDANGDLLPFVLDGSTLILDQQTFLHLNRDIIEKLEHLGAAGAIEVLSAWVANRNRQATAKAAAAAAAANRTGANGVAGPATAGAAAPKVGSAPLPSRPLGQQTAGVKPGVAPVRPAGAAGARPAAAGGRPLPGPAAPGETLIKVIGMIAEVAAVRGDVNIVGPNASALLTYIKAVGIEIDMPTAERVWATGVVPPLTGRPPASRPGPIGRTPAPTAGAPRQTIGGSSGVVPSANRPPAPSKFAPGTRPASVAPKMAPIPAARLNGVTPVRPLAATAGAAALKPAASPPSVVKSSPKPAVSSLAPPARPPGGASPVSAAPAPVAKAAIPTGAPPAAPPAANPLKRKAEEPVLDVTLSDYSSLIGVGAMPIEDDEMNGGEAKKART